MEYQEEDIYAAYTGSVVIRVSTYNFEFSGTCLACPEQYDVYLEGKQVGYVRLRWGRLYCAYPDVGGEIIYEYNYPEDSSFKGCFDSDDERKYHLELIAQALYNRIFNAEHTAES